MKEILLSQGYFALVDDKNYEWLNTFKWFVDVHGNSIYGRAYVNKRATFMHRLILGVTDRSLFIDHKDGNGLNNQEANLRIATYSQNMANRRLHKDKTSKYLGVCFHKKTGKWEVQIRKDLKKIYIGRFKNELDAAVAYNEAAIKYHGEFARLNSVEDKINPIVETRGVLLKSNIL